MKYSKDKLDSMLDSLMYTLQSVHSAGMCLVWMYSLISARFCKKIGNEYVVNLSACLDTLPDHCKSFVRYLSDYRNVYVHEGVLNTKAALVNILSCDKETIQDVMTLASVPQNAQDVFWKWYESGVVE